MQKRDSRRTRPLPEEAEVGRGAEAPGADPALQVEEKDFLDWLLGTLPGRLGQVASLKLEGWEDADIEKALNISRSTLWRNLQTIRRTWRKYLGPLIEGFDETRESGHE